MIYLYKTNGVITVGEDGKVPVTYYGRGGKSGKFYPTKIKGILPYGAILPNQYYYILSESLENVPSLGFSGNNIPSISNSGSGVTFAISINPSPTTIDLTIDNTGNGYAIGDIITINGIDVGCSGGNILIKITDIIYDSFLINIGGDNYQVVWENLVIDGTSPTSFSDANNLLLNLFS